jgi:hypothetical protein
LGDKERGILGKLGEIFFDKYFKSIEVFPFNLRSIEEEGFETEGMVEGVIGLFLRFFLDNIFSGSTTREVFFGFVLAMVFFSPHARIVNVESAVERF